VGSSKEAGEDEWALNDDINLWQHSQSLTIVVPALMVITRRQVSLKAERAPRCHLGTQIPHIRPPFAGWEKAGWHLSGVASGWHPGAIWVPPDFSRAASGCHPGA